MGALKNATVAALFVFFAFILIFMYDPLNLFEIISQNVDYFQFAILMALFVATIVGMKSRK